MSTVRWTNYLLDDGTVVAKLLESIDHAKKAHALGARFNFTVIM